MAKILIIDDEAAILNLMSKSCRQQGHDVTAVQTGKDGIKALDAFRPDLMIVDLLIGDMNGLDIIHDERIDPLKNMDLWLSQVQACDAVLSVANTTIHGSGGLNIPTMCLLSLFSDWRWLVDSTVQRSYWYPSVGIARQTKTSGWKDALDVVSSWFDNGCPAPV